MKKLCNLLLISSCLFAFNSCQNQANSDSPVDVSESSNKESEIISEKGSEDDGDKVEKEILALENKKFSSVDELYLLPNESYYLSKMLNNETDKVSYYSTLKDIVSCDKGLIKANEEIEFNDVEIIGNLYIYNSQYYQKIDLHIVDQDEYGTYFMSVDKGRLYNKKVMFFGDSITHNWARYTHEGDIVPGSDPNSLGTAYNYTTLLNNACKFQKAVNAAWSGGTMSYLPKSDQRPTWKSLPYCVDEHKKDIEETEYIFIFYGTNDLQEQVPIGNDTDTMTLDATINCSFKASMKYSIETIKETNPNAKIIFFNLLFRTYSYTGDITENDYNDAISSMCQAYMLKMIDVSHLFNTSNFTSGQKYSSDGLHPNDEGYKVLSQYILSGQIEK